MSVRLPHTIETVSGEDFDYRDPVVTLQDVAHGLGMECRFGRQTSRFYSVAEHSVLVTGIVEQLTEDRDIILASLWHDAHEAYMGDAPTPLKGMLGAKWREVADRIDDDVATYLGLDSRVVLTHPLIKYADKEAMLYEASVLKDGDGWAFTRRMPHTRAKAAAADYMLDLNLLPEEAKTLFLNTHYHLARP